MFFNPLLIKLFILLPNGLVFISGFDGVFGGLGLSGADPLLFGLGLGVSVLLGDGDSSNTSPSS